MAKIYGNKSGNVLFGTADSDYIDGISGDDFLYGFEGDDTLNGGLGTDYLDGGTGADTLLGGSGNDLLQSGVGFFTGVITPANDQIDGGGGNEDLALFDWRGTTTAVTFSIADPATKQFFAGTSLVNVERIFYLGGAGDSVVTGGALNDELAGGSGNDLLDGGGGIDRIVGDEGDDILHGGEGDDRVSDSLGHNELYGGGGDDLITGSFENFADEGGAVDGGDGYDQLTVSADGFFRGGEGLVFDYDRLAASARISNVEAFHLDVIVPPANEGPIRLTIFGGALDDLLIGDETNDVLDGRGGDDTLIGRTGKDIMTGGSGVDRFVFNVEYYYHGVTVGLPDSRAGGGVRDVITDFTTGEDKIDLSPLGYTDFSAISTKAFGSGIIVSYDVDGDGADYDQDFAVQLNGVRAISEGDFLFATV